MRNKSEKDCGDKDNQCMVPEEGLEPTRGVTLGRF